MSQKPSQGEPNESPWPFNRTQFFRIFAIFKAARRTWGRLHLLYFMYLGLPFSRLQVNFVPSVHKTVNFPLPNCNHFLVLPC